MELINAADFQEAERIINSRQRIPAESLRKLCLVLMQGCTPYLGYHGKVEAAFAEFVQSTGGRAEERA